MRVHIEGGGSKGSYQMYNPPITGDDVTWGEELTRWCGATSTLRDDRVRITIETEG